MTEKPPHVFHRLLSEFLAYNLLKRARIYRRTFPQVAVFAHDFIGTEIAVYGRYENRELAALSQLITKIDRATLVLDVGANIGNHTLFFVEEGFENIHAFEPNPRALRLLQLNTERFPQVTVHPFGLSDKHASLDATIPMTNAGGASLEAGQRRANNAERESTTFEVWRFDDLSVKNSPVGLLKLDVEGHEPEALAGMMEMLRRDRPLVVVECNNKTDRQSAERLVALLRDAGYSGFAAIEPPGSAIPQTLPRILRSPLRLLERLVSPRLSHCEVRSVEVFEERNYPMIVASREPFA